MARVRDPEGIEARKLTWSGQLTGKHVLEVGCGSGWLTWQFAGTVKTVIGIDPGFTGLQDARSNQPSKIRNAYFMQAEGENLPFAGGKFDAVIFSNSL
jgi:ubiquinone/menaquinone biosynthesis C-methylase UbiE